MFDRGKFIRINVLLSWRKHIKLTLWFYFFFDACQNVAKIWWTQLWPRLCVKQLKSFEHVTIFQITLQSAYRELRNKRSGLKYTRKYTVGSCLSSHSRVINMLPGWKRTVSWFLLLILMITIRVRTTRVFFYINTCGFSKADTQFPPLDGDTDLKLLT